MLASYAPFIFYKHLKIIMKKHILTPILAVLLTVTAFAQIPNGGFETFTNMGTYDIPNGWGTMNNTTSPMSVFTAEKGTPGSPGSSYLKLTSKTVLATVVNGIAVSGEIDSTTMLPKSGFPYVLRPLNFTGKWQHMIYGSSQGSVTALLTRWDSGMGMRIPVATATQTLSGMAMSWANFTIPFTYVDAGNPDTCIIILKASGTTPTNNDYLWVDNLAFSGFTGINENSSFLNNMSVYPNPTTNKIILDLNYKTAEQTIIQLTDITGKIVLSKNVGELNGQSKQIMDVSSVAKGSYFVRIITTSGTEVRKIVIE
jgi:hypothetical protein